MKNHLAWPVLATAMTLAAAFSVQAAADRECTAAPVIAAADAPVADDPEQPLDPRDPLFVEKSAQRYRQLGSRPEHRAMAAKGARP